MGEYDIQTRTRTRRRCHQPIEMHPHMRQLENDLSGVHQKMMAGSRKRDSRPNAVHGIV